VSTTLLFQVFVYLAAAVLAAPVAKRLGLGSVLGYLIAGAIIGPFALDAVGAAEDTRHVAEFGVVILLFLIGLEVRPALLWRMKGVIFGLGGAQVAGSALVLGAAALALGLDWREALATGLILAMSSTAIVLQTLEERGLRQGPVGQTGFGVLLFQDLAVIPLLALLPLLAVASHGGTDAGGHAEAGGVLAGAPAWLQGVAVLVAVGGVIGIGRYAIRPVFRYIAAARLREIFTAAALLLVVGVAVLMQSVGLSPALGAFVAGVVLAESEFRRELETDIEPFRGLLLGLFFITVGAGLDFGLVAAQPFLVLGLVLGLMLLKALVMFAAAVVTGSRREDAGMVAVALSQGGEFAFVLLGFAVAAGTLGQDLTSLLTAVVALSMAATPLAVGVYARLTQRAAGARAEPENEPFDERPPDAIIAGYGRFGQIIARVLTANGFVLATLDSSIEQIDLLRRFGRRVYYGDATRLDLLRAAGAEKAKVLVVAIDDRDQAVRLVEAAREAFPHLAILARSYDRRDLFDLMRNGADHVERETFESALHMAVVALQRLGLRREQADTAAKVFRRHDLRQIATLAPLWGDEERYALAVRESTGLMEKLLRADLERSGVLSRRGDGAAGAPEPEDEAA
jgi:glutathione-regulated potassium-efflux system ancillary protein KefC/glutathione-regulated potassium-efflux system protein KefB